MRRISRSAQHTVTRIAGTAALCLAASLSMAGCVGSPPSSTSSAAPAASSSLESVCDDAAVASCETNSDGFVVTVTDDATASAVLHLVDMLHAAASVGGSPGDVVLTRGPLATFAIDGDYTPPPTWTATVFPTALSEAESTVASMLEIEATGGALGIAVVDGWPTVTITTLDAAGAVFDAASTTPLFADGGSYAVFSYEYAPLSIVHTPRWVGAESVHTLIELSVAHPDAEVLLQAAPGGESAPTLFVAHLTDDEISAIDALLQETSLAAFGNGVGVPYVLGPRTDGTSATGTIGEPAA